MSRSRPRIVLAGMLLGVVLFLAGVNRLFSLRFSAGDIFPAGSSRRADPRGTRAFFEALAELPDREVVRNLEPVRRLPAPERTTLFLWGVPPRELASDTRGEDWREVARFAAAGGRVVVGLAPDDDAMSPAPAAPAPGRAPSGFQPTTAWQFAILPGVQPAQAVTRQAEVDTLPPRIDWPASPVFAVANPPWETLYGSAAGAVMIRRTIGPGELILLADDTLARNGALRTGRETALLAWLAGDRTRMVFDETHLGLSLEPGIASLLRRYRLGGALAGAVLLGLLYAWRSSSPFHVTPATASGSEGIVRGRAADEGLLNLLSRSLPAPDLAGVCLHTWREDPGLTRRVPSDVLEAMQDLVNREDALPARERDPVATYQSLSRLLHPPRSPWKST